MALKNSREESWISKSLFTRLSFGVASQLFLINSSGRHSDVVRNSQLLDGYHIFSFLTPDLAHRFKTTCTYNSELKPDLISDLLENLLPIQEYLNISICFNLKNYFLFIEYTGTFSFARIHAKMENLQTWTMCKKLIPQNFSDYPNLKTPLAFHPIWSTLKWVSPLILRFLRGLLGLKIACRVYWSSDFCACTSYLTLFPGAVLLE